MKKKNFEKKIKFEYFEDNSNPEQGSFKWWPVSPESFDDLLLHSFLDDDKYQLHIKWSRKSLEELWKYLINLANYDTVDPDHHIHFDDLDDIKWNTELIIHHSESEWKPK